MKKKLMSLKLMENIAIDKPINYIKGTNELYNDLPSSWNPGHTSLKVVV